MPRTLTLLALLGVAAGTLAPGAVRTQNSRDAATPAPSTDTWSRLPSNADVDKVYPVEAKLSAVWGRVLLRCRVATDGRLQECLVASEAPSGWGFGKAALELAPLYQDNVTAPAGAADIGTLISLPIGFAIPGQCANCAKSPAR
jgi:protein TonB